MTMKKAVEVENIFDMIVIAFNLYPQGCRFQKVNMFYWMNGVLCTAEAETAKKP